jgi:hypothetical protein
MNPFSRPNIFYTVFLILLLGLFFWDITHHYWWSTAWDAIIIGWLGWDFFIRPNKRVKRQHNKEQSK